MTIEAQDVQANAIPEWAQPIQPLKLSPDALAKMHELLAAPSQPSKGLLAAAERQRLARTWEAQHPGHRAPLWLGRSIKTQLEFKRKKWMRLCPEAGAMFPDQLAYPGESLKAFARRKVRENHRDAEWAKEWLRRKGCQC